MNPNLTAVILIILAIALFFSFTDAEYLKIKEMQSEVQAYQVAGDRSKELLSKRNELTDKFNKIDPVNLEKLQKLIPDTIDSVRLIIEIGDLTGKYGVPLRNIQVNTASIDKSKAGSSAPDKDGGKYNSALISFSVSTTYENFLELLRGIENSLRMIDVVSVTFNASDEGLYQFNVTMRTYWMK